MKTWDEVEAEARETVRAAMAEAKPLAIGDRVAWADCYYTKTVGISEIHRVGPELTPKGEQIAYCGEVIPDALRRFPTVLRSLDVCGVCENRHHQAVAVALRWTA